ncbi:MAG: CDP-alcohol phosphatidyltransferase family protein [bacterium]|nr:CDP-alcohol phosphatidyltransferase family protein [bacterium]
MREDQPIREFATTVLTPLARRLEFVHPNVITWLALLTGCCAGVAYWLTRVDSKFFFLAAVLVIVSGVGDCLDGVMARLHERTSASGDFLDHFFDRLVNIAIVVGMALTPNASLTLGLGVMILVLLNSYLGTQIEASFGKRYYTGMGRAELFIGLIAVTILLGFLPNSALSLAGREMSLVNMFLIIVGFSTMQGILHRFRLAMRLARAQEN